MLWVLRRGDSNEYPQHTCMFLWRTAENYLSIIIKYPPYLVFWSDCSWSKSTLLTFQSASFQHMSTSITKWRAPGEDSDQPGQSMLYAQWVATDPRFLHAQRRLIRLGGCPGCSESSLDAQVIILVSSCISSYMCMVKTTLFRFSANYSNYSGAQFLR